MDRIKRRQSGICLSEVKGRKQSNDLKKGGFLLFLMRSVVIWILGAAWWNCFFDVFPANIDKVWLLGLLIALTTVPLLFLWAQILVGNRGKVLAAALSLIPVIISAAEGFLSDGAENLKRIAGFSPGDGEGMIKVSSVRPKGTMYYPIEYGGTYTGYTWEMHPDSDEVYPEYTLYPEGLSRLIALCNKAEIHSLEDACGFIQQEFEENTVYDYSPGVTPDNQDFAEYFLFDNKKGFCVHFATTATLMYRIFGFRARYVQGYAVPASAFAEQEDGTYEAEVTGEMGHAWCETYDGTWTVREHTLPYMGDEPQVLAPAAANMLKEVQPEISAEEWAWIQTLVWRSMFDRTVPSKEEHAKLYRIVGKLAGEVGRTLTGWRKIEYHYIKCLG